jgi:hypothetical protein
MSRTAGALLPAGALVGLAAVACCEPREPLVVTDPCREDPSSTDAPADLRCTGLYEQWETKRVAWAARNFSPGTPLWSDGAEKRRWLYLPPGETIDASDPDEWVFPVGTKAWKEFSRGGRRIETRLFAKVTPDRWHRATYLWSADGETAVRTDGGLGNWEGTGHEIPPVTLEGLVRDGGLVPALDPTAARVPEAMPAAQRAALSWLHINCGVSCHNRAADARAMGTNLFLRLELGQLAAAREGAGALDPVITTVEVATRSARWPGVRVVPGARRGASSSGWPARAAPSRCHRC